MANYAVWNNRLRHEWLAKPRKGKYLNKRTRERCGLEEALSRKGDEAGADDEAKADAAEA